MSSETRVDCTLTTCSFYSTKPPDKACYCKHPDKPHYIGGGACPLFKANWTAQDEKSAEMRSQLVRMQKRAHKVNRRKKR